MVQLGALIHERQRTALYMEAINNRLVLRCDVSRGRLHKGLPCRSVAIETPKQGDADETPRTCWYSVMMPSFPYGRTIHRTLRSQSVQRTCPFHFQAGQTQRHACAITILFRTGVTLFSKKCRMGLADEPSKQKKATTHIVHCSSQCASTHQSV